MTASIPWLQSALNFFLNRILSYGWSTMNNARGKWGFCYSGVGRCITGQTDRDVSLRRREPFVSAAASYVRRTASNAPETSKLAAELFALFYDVPFVRQHASLLLSTRYFWSQGQIGWIYARNLSHLTQNWNWNSYRATRGCLAGGVVSRAGGRTNWVWGNGVGCVFTCY
jgi:hypothetical protein